MTLPKVHAMRSPSNPENAAGLSLWAARPIQGDLATQSIHVRPAQLWSYTHTDFNEGEEVLLQHGKQRAMARPEQWRASSNTS